MFHIAICNMKKILFQFMVVHNYSNIQYIILIYKSCTSLDNSLNVIAVSNH